MNDRLSKLMAGATMLFKGDCNEERLEQTSRELGYKHPEDYFSADKAAKFLGVSRNPFYDLVHKYKLQHHKFNNAPIGYYIKDLERVKKTLK